MSTFTIFLALIVVVAFLLVIVIMVQNPKGGGLSSSFGGGGTQQMGGWMYLIYMVNYIKFIPTKILYIQQQVRRGKINIGYLAL